jgi:hypothetical protein
MLAHVPQGNAQGRACSCESEANETRFRLNLKLIPPAVYNPSNPGQVFGFGLDLTGHGSSAILCFVCFPAISEKSITRGHFAGLATLEK